MFRPVHFEIHASDAARARKFYATLFGWEFTKSRGAALPYWLIHTGTDGPGVNGGLLGRRGRPPVDVQATNAFVWIARVPSVDDWLIKVERAGGRIAFPKEAVTGVGWLAYVRDPEGNVFGMMEPDPSAG